MLIGRAAILRLIPHAAEMCLLDGVTSRDGERIVCAATSHLSPGNPLRHGGRLGILCGVEYAAQAMAVHGALAAAETGIRIARGGYLASVRDLEWHADRLDLLTGPLEIEARLLHGEGDRVIYGFCLRHDGAGLLEGRAAVVLEAALS